MPTVGGLGGESAADNNNNNNMNLPKEQIIPLTRKSPDSGSKLKGLTMKTPTMKSHPGHRAIGFGVCSLIVIAVVFLFSKDSLGKYMHGVSP
jgi:hypothetical protein